MDEHRILTILKKIRATHVKEDETFYFDIKPLIKIVEDIMSFTSKKDDIPHQGIHVKRTFFEDINLGNKTSRDKLVVMINTFAWELERSCSSDEIKIDEIVLDLFKKLSSYSWPGKAVIALSAFAINYGQFLLVEQLSATDPVSQSLAFLEQLPTTMEKKKSDFETVTKMIDSILNLTTCFSESVDNILSHNHLQSNSPLLKELRAQIQSCTYWIIRSILICQSQFANEYTELSSEVSTKLSDMVDKVSQVCKSLRGQMDSCLKEAEKNRQEKIYQNLKSTVERLTKMVEKDNTSILKALIPDYQNMPLYNASSEKPVGIDNIAKKTVLLYFSDLKQCIVEFPVLLDLYNKPKQRLNDYEILWIPMVEKSSPKKDETFHNIRKKMPWLSILDLKLVDPAVIRFIREDWNSNRRSKIVVISHQGMLVNLEAIHMILIWGRSAKFPFYERFAEELWEKENWSVELLLNNIEVEPSVAQWINEDKYVCLYGGEDSEWILKFYETILATSQQAKMPMKMLYMGTSNKSGIIKENIDLITSKKLSIETIDSTKIQLFWTRIDCMWHSLVQAGKLDDEIMRGVLKMRSFDCSGRGWAIISKGYSSKEMASGMGDTMLKCLSEYHLWESNAEKKGFVPALTEHISSVGPIKSTTNTFSVPNIADGLSVKTECFECRKQMQRMTRFSCSGD